MPFLRFSKDRRGYESTFLLHPRRAGDRDAPILLYWFRTPPHVKMGRAALDEETIRVLEDTHPAVDFDWPRILAARPQPTEPPPDPNRPPRARRRGERGEERGAPRGPKGPPPSRAELPAAAAPPRPVVPPREVEAEVVRERTEIAPAGPPAKSAAAPLPVPEPSPEPDEPETPVRKFTRIFDAAPGEPAGNDAEGAGPAAVGRLSEPSASDRALGGEELERLRGRHAAVLARIARRITDPALADRLRALAERANPDGWVTDDEVKAGLAGLNDVYAELVPHVGRRRRRRRSGRRNRAESGAPVGPDSPAAAGAHEAAPPDDFDEDAADDGDSDGPEDDGSSESGG